MTGSNGRRKTLGPRTDLAIQRADVLDAELCPPTQGRIEALRRERMFWLVGTAAAGTVPAPILAKSAGFRTMGAYRQALFRARKALEA